MKGLFKTFRSRLFLSYLVLSAAVLGSAFLLVYHKIENVELSALKAKLSDEAALLSARLTTNDLASPKINELAHSLGERVHCRVTIIAAGGRVLADSELDEAGVKGMENHAHRPEVMGAMAGRPAYAMRTSATLGKEMLYAAYPVRVSGGRTEAAARFSVPATDIAAAREPLRRSLLAALAIALLLSFLLSLLVSAGLTRPFNKIIYASKKFAAGDFGYRIQKDFHGEIGKLAETLNSMAASIEENLRRVELQSQQLSAAFTGMAEGVLMTGADSRIISVNPALERMLGLRAADAVSRPLLEVVPSARLSEICARVVEGASPVSGEAEFSVPVRGVFGVNASPVFTGGRVSGCMVLMRDVTEARRLDATRRDFVANVSHELKTPLTAIKGSAETLLDGALEDREHGPQFARSIYEQASRLDNIVSDLLKLSSLESPQAAVRKERVELRMFADSVIKSLAPAFAPRKAEVTNEIPAGLCAQADPEKLKQVLINLLDNAVKFCAGAPKVSLTAEELPSAVRVTVTDNGIGIPASHLPRVFERFYRVDKARSREMGGTGLGLSIVRHVVELHGGSVGAESAEGAGSRFWFTLPPEKMK